MKPITNYYILFEGYILEITENALFCSLLLSYITQELFHIIQFHFTGLSKIDSSIINRGNIL